MRDLAIIVGELMAKDKALIDREVESKRKNVERGVGGKEAKAEFAALEKIQARK